jgi:hypothetical protein
MEKRMIVHPVVTYPQLVKRINKLTGVIYLKISTHV